MTHPSNDFFWLRAVRTVLHVFILRNRNRTKRKFVVFWFLISNTLNRHIKKPSKWTPNVKRLKRKCSRRWINSSPFKKVSITNCLLHFAACFSQSQIFLHWGWLDEWATNWPIAFVYRCYLFIEFLFFVCLSEQILCWFPDFSKLVQQRELLDGQLNENKSVLEELNLLKDDNQVSDVMTVWSSNGDANCCAFIFRCTNYMGQC